MADVATPKRPGHQIAPWTFDDLHALPDDGWRYEIVDGSLTMTPPPGIRHEAISARLLVALSGHVPDDHEVIGPIGVDLHPSYRIPDLCVIPGSVARRDDELVSPADILLAVEIVSPGSQTTDRVTKTAQYAKASIPAYWRIETRPRLSLTAYVLRPGDEVYSELGSWGENQTALVKEPFHAELPLADLAP